MTSILPASYNHPSLLMPAYYQAPLLEADWNISLVDKGEKGRKQPASAQIMSLWYNELPSLEISSIPRIHIIHNPQIQSLDPKLSSIALYDAMTPICAMLTNWLVYNNIQNSAQFLQLDLLCKTGSIIFDICYFKTSTTLSLCLTMKPEKFISFDINKGSIQEFLWTCLCLVYDLDWR